MSPDKKYQIIYADPPWSYHDKMRGYSLSLDLQYKTQSKKWIAALPVKDIAEKESVLFLWVTSPHLPTGIEVMKAWGFKYVTVAFCWSKYTAHGKKIHNLGRWTMGNVELCLLGKRGRPRRACKNVKQLVEAARTRHSQKPDEVRTRIVALMGDLPRIELFAREKVEGWDVWGDEVESDITL